MTAFHELQDVVDELGRRLQRSVAIDDPQMRLVAYSRHYGPVDETRRDSILQRVAEGPGIDHARSFGIERATEPVRVGGLPSLGQLPRVCVPVLHQGLRLGYLWLIDADESLTDEEIALASEAAAHAAATLYRTRLVRELERGRERELLRDLLAHEVELRRMAASRLVEENLLAPGPVVVLVVRGVPLDDEETRLVLDTTLAEASRRLPARHGSHLLRHDHGVLVVVPTARQAGPAALRELAERLRDDVARRTGAGPGRRPLVGIGGLGSELAEAATSYDQAGLAARVAQHVSTTGDVARWDELGVYRTLARLPHDQLASEAVDPALSRLLAADTDGTYVSTLETFLDLAGNASRTAEALQVHRTSVYYRLGRISEITGLDLEDGNSRLALHLSLKLARLTGLRD